MVAGCGLLGWGIYNLGNSLKLRVSPVWVSVERRFLGTPRVRMFRSEQVKRVVKNLSFQTGKGLQVRAYYQIVVERRDGKGLVVGDSLPSAGAADYVVAQIEQALGGIGGHRGGKG